MIRLFTPLVLCSVLAVLILCIVRLVLLPESWVSSLVALFFLPAVITALVLRARSQSSDRAKVSGKLRAALVGAGVALAGALLLSITDELRLTEATSSDGWRSFLPLVPAAIAVIADVMSARLEQKALEEED